MKASFSDEDGVYICHMTQADFMRVILAVRNEREREGVTEKGRRHLQGLLETMCSAAGLTGAEELPS